MQTRSVWKHSGNDVIGDLAVVLGAAGVFATGIAWRDLLEPIIAALRLSGGVQIMRQAKM